MRIDFLTKSLFAGLSMAFFVFLAFPFETFAATYYVAQTPNASDSNTGTLEQPFLTINKGVSVLAAGDTLFVRTGIYAESLIHNIPAGTAWTNPVKVAAFPGESVTIRPSVGTNDNFVFEFGDVNQQYIIIDGFIIDGVNLRLTDAGTGAVVAAACVKIWQHHIRFNNVEIKGCPSYGFWVTPSLGTNNPGSDNELVNSKIHDTGVTQDTHAIYFLGPRNILERTEIYNNPGGGIAVQNFVDDIAHDNVLRYNLFRDNGYTTDYAHAIYVAVGNRTLIHNNIVRSQVGSISFPGHGITVDGLTNFTKVYNNTVYGNQGVGIYILAGALNVEVKNNISFSNGIDITNNQTGTTLSNNLTTDPSFMNAAAADFHLQPTSPAINTGVNLAPTVVNDFDGVSRPQPPGGLWDIGAYEFVSAPTPAINTLRLGVSLEKDQRVDQKTFTVKILNPVTGAVLLERSLNPQAGLITLTALNLEPGSYGVRISAPSHLARKLTQILTENLLITFPPLLAGDLNQDNIINSIDWSNMNPNWNTSDTISDLNGDNTTNSLDWSLMNKNWLRAGE